MATQQKRKKWGKERLWRDPETFQLHAMNQIRRKCHFGCLYEVLSNSQFQWAFRLRAATISGAAEVHSVVRELRHWGNQAKTGSDNKQASWDRAKIRSRPLFGNSKPISTFSCFPGYLTNDSLLQTGQMMCSFPVHASSWWVIFFLNYTAINFCFCFNTTLLGGRTEKWLPSHLIAWKLQVQVFDRVFVCEIFMFFLLKCGFSADTVASSCSPKDTIPISHRVNKW